MIRVNKCQFDELVLYARYYTDDFDTWVCGDAPNMEFKELEPAPPKDFKPKCHFLTFHVQTDIDEGHDEPLCVTCDIRKECIYKRE
jgi:hypothetical protein